MTNDGTQTPDPFGPEDYEAVKAGIMRAFAEAVSAGSAAATEAAPAATPAESARLLDEAFERWERAHGLNVLQFPSRVARSSTNGTEGGAA